MGRSMIFLVSGFLIIFGIIQQSVQNRQRVLAERAPEYYYQEQSRNIAGATLEMALGNINSGFNYQPQNAENSIDVDPVPMMGGEGKIVSITPSNFNTRFEVKITGEIEKPDGSTALTTIDAVFNRKAFSIYAYFTNTEPVIWFVTGDELNGPVHTNGKFHIDGDPVFNGPITSHGGVTKKSGSDPEYNGGADFGANEVPLPEDAPEVVKLAKKENGGIGQFDEEITVEFHGNGSGNNDGTVDIITEGQTGTRNGRCLRWEGSWIFRHCVEWEQIPVYGDVTKTYNISDFNGVISSTKDVKVKGTVDGQVTVHSEKDVEIIGDIVYENRNYEKDSQNKSDDRLGIVSEGETIVSRDAHKDDTYGDKNNKDVYIDASILALGESFRVEGYDDGDSRGTLNILGGLIQRERGAVGLVSGSGYLKNYNYDTRFLESSTPGFPRKKKFEIENWRESTRTIKIDE